MDTDFQSFWQLAHREYAAMKLTVLPDGLYLQALQWLQ